MSGTLITEDPPTIYNTAKDANCVASLLESQEEDGWTYEVITSPKSGKSVIAVYDEDGNLMGNL
jgi:hypothetical protein